MGMPVYALQQALPGIETEESWEQRRKQIEDAVGACEGASHYKSKLKKFLLESEITGVAEMDYPLRMKYEAFLNDHIVPGKVKGYLNLFDQVTCNSLAEQMQTLAGRQKHQWQYKNEILFLRYHPDQEIARSFNDTRQMEVLVWDFQVECPETMKRQIFTALTEVINTCADLTQRRVRLLALKYFYNFCVRQQVADLEVMELPQIQDYYGQLYLEKGKKQHTAYESVVNFSRKIAFLKEREIRWDANVWYLERFHLPESRYNYSKSLDSISFLEIEHMGNRKCAQHYMRYELGINSQALSTVTRRYLAVRNFIVSLGEQDVCSCSAGQVEAYVKTLQEKDIQAKGFNERLSGIQHFFKFLEVRKYIKRSPFRAEYYYQKELPVHHDRSVEYDVYIEIIKKLPAFPERLRCMFLHLWCLGLRASEVCTLKGNAYFRQGKEPWIQVYQVKMKNYKRIPIPEGLYRIMKVYLKKNQIGPMDYIFQNSRGGACLYATFRTQMIKACEENEIQGGEYIFKSHDYRHTVATMFYDNQVSLQSIRDYLGHHYEEMTRQYIDYMPKKLAQANEEYFGDPENDLASCLKKGGKFGSPKNLL